MSLANLSEFVLERNASVMFLLVKDVTLNLIDVRLTHRKDAVPSLPLTIGVNQARFLVHLDVSVFIFLITSMVANFGDSEHRMWI